MHPRDRTPLLLFGSIMGFAASTLSLSAVDGGPLFQGGPDFADGFYLISSLPSFTPIGSGVQVFLFGADFGEVGRASVDPTTLGGVGADEFILLVDPPGIPTLFGDVRFGWDVTGFATPVPDPRLGVALASGGVFACARVPLRRRRRILGSSRKLAPSSCSSRCA